MLMSEGSFFFYCVIASLESMDEMMTRTLYEKKRQRSNVSEWGHVGGIRVSALTAKASHDIPSVEGIQAAG